jgi:hypothetical protein
MEQSTEFVAPGHFLLEYIGVVKQEPNKINIPPNVPNVHLKTAEFNQAMQRYNSSTLYTRLERMNSILVLSLQAAILINVLQTYDGSSFITLLSAFVIAYILTDFVNGLMHMYMDNNTAYTSIIGPFVSSFHLHHSRIQYTKRHPLKIYFYESGTKFWLLAYLIGVTTAQHLLNLNYPLNLGLVSIGILSSVAELSHYWCHNATRKNKIVSLLQKYRLLLSKKHHATHHRDDNTHYAFLNGMTDPLLILISHYFYAGYKNHADKHTRAYIKQTKTQDHSLLE